MSGERANIDPPDFREDANVQSAAGNLRADYASENIRLDRQSFLLAPKIAGCCLVGASVRNQSLMDNVVFAVVELIRITRKIKRKFWKQHQSARFRLTLTFSLGKETAHVAMEPRVIVFQAAIGWIIVSGIGPASSSLF